MLPAHMVYWFCTFKNQARFPPPINKHRYDCERYRALKKVKKGTQNVIHLKKIT